MKLICIMVSSLNGKILLGNTLSHDSWTSQEDKKYFTSLLDNAQCIIMGRKTYEAAKSQMVHKKGRLRVILTGNPQQYKNDTIPGQLEFSSLKPPKLLKYLSTRGFSEALLIGGPATNVSFFKENLVDGFWLTLEPVILPHGISLFAEDIFPTPEAKDIQRENPNTSGVYDKKLQLLSMKQLNPQGTLLLKYLLQKTY